MGDVFNTDVLLPVGERLRPLLNKSCISETAMKTILAERGVYIGNSSKKLSIPMLTLSILSPKEFEKLQELQKNKEDSLKTKTTVYKSLSNININDLIPLDLIKKENLLDEFDSFIFDTDLSFNVESPNKLTLEYAIVRNDITKDWTSNQSRYTGRIEIEKINSNNEIHFSSEYTSSETETVNKKIVKTVSEHLQTKGEVSNTEKPFEITSDIFNNTQRFSFMLMLANDSPNGYLNFKAVKNIEIGPDRTITLAGSAKWMEGSVKNIIINSEKGETLEKIEYISDTKYHKSLILRQVQAEYSFEIGSAKGTCIIEYGFPHFFRSHNKSTSFEASVAWISFSKDSKSENSKTASRNILKEFQCMLQKEYAKITSH